MSKQSIQTFGRSSAIEQSVGLPHSNEFLSGLKNRLEHSGAVTLETLGHPNVLTALKEGNDYLKKAGSDNIGFYKYLIGDGPPPQDYDGSAIILLQSERSDLKNLMKTGTGFLCFSPAEDHQKTRAKLEHLLELSLKECGGYLDNREVKFWPPERMLNAIRTAGDIGNHKNLAEYLVQRNLVNEGPDDQETVNNLKKANEASSLARKTVPGGRGNVKGDLEKTKNESYFTVSVAQQTANTYLKMRPEIPFRPHSIAHAAANEAGNCGEISRLAAAYFARNESKDIINLVANKDIGHTWMKIVDEKGQEICVDPWQNGPVILNEDSNFKESFFGYSVPSDKREEFIRDINKAAAIANHPTVREYSKKLVQNFKESGLLPLPSEVFPDGMDIRDPEFIKSAQDKAKETISYKNFLEKGGEGISEEDFKNHEKYLQSVRNSILAHHALRQLSANVKQASEMATEIVDQVKNPGKPSW